MRGNLWAPSPFRVEADVLRTATSDRALCDGGGQVGLRLRQRGRAGRQEHAAHSTPEVAATDEKAATPCNFGPLFGWPIRPSFSCRRLLEHVFFM